MRNSDLVDRVTKAAIDNGQLIEAGWLGLQHAFMPPEAGAVQIREMRQAFFAGAQHLFASIISTLEAGTEPTDADLRRMSNIHEELHAFVEQMKRELSQRKESR